MNSARYIDNNLQKIVRTNISENTTGQAFLIAFLSQLTDLKFRLNFRESWLKWYHLLLILGRYLRFNFKNCVVPTCRGTVCSDQLYKIALQKSHDEHLIYFFGISVQKQMFCVYRKVFWCFQGVPKGNSGSIWVKKLNLLDFLPD